MQRSSEVLSRRKNARELKKKITEERHHLEDPYFRINNQLWKELKKKIR
jgi:hypothetical protein